nr:hypothetical protein Itr_chr06CG17650 [Ipomoea trifida]
MPLPITNHGLSMRRKSSPLLLAERRCWALNAVDGKRKTATAACHLRYYYELVGKIGESSTGFPLVCCYIVREKVTLELLMTNTKDRHRSLVAVLLFRTKQGRARTNDVTPSHCFVAEDNRLSPINLLHGVAACCHGR